MIDYSLEYIVDHRLYILLPFLFFNYEKQLGKAPGDSSLYEKIRNLYNAVISRLRELADFGSISAYEANTIFDALKIVFEALGKTNKAEQEVVDIMGGEILEFSADKFYNAGLADGKAIGEADGRKEGRDEGEQKMADLAARLAADGKSDEIVRAAMDKEYRSSLYEKYAIL